MVLVATALKLILKLWISTVYTKTCIINFAFISPQKHFFCIVSVRGIIYKSYIILHYTSIQKNVAFS